MKSGCLKAVLLGGLIGGAGDLAFALIYNGVRGTPPVELLQVIASGVFGKAAFDGGVAMAATGFCFHFLLLLGWAALIIAAMRRLPGLAARPLPAAIAFGTVVFFTMRLAVLPLSAFPFPVNFKPLGTALDLLSHMFLFAWPMVWMARKYCRPAVE